MIKFDWQPDCPGRDGEAYVDLPFERRLHVWFDRDRDDENKRNIWYWRVGGIQSSRFFRKPETARREAEKYITAELDAWTKKWIEIRL